MQTADVPDTCIQGIFKKEIKNRFLCLVNVDGVDVVCYIPSSCRLSNFLDLSNRIVLLKPVITKNARTKYSVYAVKYGRNYILLNLSQSNRVIEEQIGRRYFSFLGKRKSVSRETTVSGYKSDLFIRDTNTIVEIKSILAFERETLFPTVYSERSLKQLVNILRLLDEGYKVCYIFVSLNPRVKVLEINRDISDFFDLFCKCAKKGMQYCGYSVRLENSEPTLYAQVSIKL